MKSLALVSTVLFLALASTQDSIFLKIQLCDCFHKTLVALRKNGPNNVKHWYLVSSRGGEINVDNA